MSRNSGAFGRGKGSFRLSEDRGLTPEKKMKSSFRNAKRNITFDPKDFITADCNEREVEMFKQVFDYLDDDHDGMLTPLDLRKAIREYGGYKPPRSFVYVAMSVFDADDGGEISFKEFVKLMTTHPCDNDTEDDIERIFSYIDEENKGFISPEDLMNCAEELKEEITPAEIREMISNCDPEGRGVITREAFIAFNKKGKFD